MNHGFCNANDFDEGDNKDDIVHKNNEAKDAGGNDDDDDDADDDDDEQEDEDWCWRNMRQ